MAGIPAILLSRPQQTLILHEPETLKALRVEGLGATYEPSYS